MGRWKEPKEELSSRIPQVCSSKQVETKQHFLLDYTAYISIGNGSAQEEGGGTQCFTATRASQMMHLRGEFLRESLQNQDALPHGDHSAK
jgi:hypothetical protein